MTGWIAVRGARLHNLRDVDVDLPRDALVAFTGVSGSGKSSLAFGTIHSESQRRYFDTVAPFARRLIRQAVAPRVRSVGGLPPTVALEQGRGAGGSRSTVGTVTALSNTVRMLFSRCGRYPAGAARLDSDHFSPNTTAGACGECDGLGRVHRATEASMVPDPGRSVADGAIASWPGAWQGKNYRDILATLGYDIHLPWRDLDQQDRRWILFTDDEPVVTVHPVREAHRIHRPYQGTYVSAEKHLRRSLSSGSAKTRERASRFVEVAPCPVCHGRRLRPDALAVRYLGAPVDDLLTWDLGRLREVAGERRADLGADAVDGEAEATLLDDLLGRLRVLTDLGLGHLTAARPAGEVSAGELQRLRLGSLLTAGLFGVLYVLDEPSAGLHPADRDPVIRLLRRLVDEGNSVIAVEHDVDVVAACDWLVDLGPGAGTDGGRVLGSAPPADLAHDSPTVTALRAAPPPPADPPRPDRWLTVPGLDRLVLRSVDLALPVGRLTCLTGVSGAGKSTLLRAVADRAEAGGLPGVDRYAAIDQQPIGRTPRSNLATYTGLFDPVRALFAGTDEARRRGYTVSRFSFNVAEGRCPTCQGEGMVEVGLMFLPGSYAPCPACHGARYGPETLQVRWRGRSVADVLDLTVTDALAVFDDQPRVLRSLTALAGLGLGYLRLGQPAPELSGGEAQRIKLANELQRPARGHTLYLLDEPGTGLHPADRARLRQTLRTLAEAGQTVLTAEHDMRSVATADWVVDLGPGAGARGGRVVYAGTPAGLAAADTATGRALRTAVAG